MICLVTGASSGIGRATALGLARLGSTVVALCRNPEQGADAVARIRQESGNERVDLLLADLSSLPSVRRAAAEFLDRYLGLQVLVNNAGLSLWRREVTEDGIERTFAVNHLGHFLLTNLLLDALKASAPARIVNVTSAAHRNGRIDFDNLQRERRYRGFGAYSDSKLANVLFTYELARRLVGMAVTANCVHPGTIATNIYRPAATGRLALLFRLLLPFMGSPERGAEPVLRAAVAPELEGVSGKYFTPRGEERSAPRSYDEAIARRLWEVSATLCGL